LHDEVERHFRALVLRDVKSSRLDFCRHLDEASRDERAAAWEVRDRARRLDPRSSVAAATLPEIAYGICIAERRGWANQQKSRVPEHPLHVAIHEAGHAIVARLCRIPCLLCTVKLEGKSHGEGTRNGYCWVRPRMPRLRRMGDGSHRPRFATPDAGVHARCLVWLGGDAAQLALLGFMYGWGGRRDEAAVVRLLEGYPAHRQRRLHRRLYRLCIAMCRRHAGLILTLAFALLRFETVPGKLIDDLVGGPDPRHRKPLDVRIMRFWGALSKLHHCVYEGGVNLADT
jgi:hypothetical protein